jgi:hypothetical protein
LIDAPLLAVLLCSVGYFFSYIQLAAWWSTMADIGGRHVGALFGLGNMIGLGGGALSQVFRFIRKLRTTESNGRSTGSSSLIRVLRLARLLSALSVESPHSRIPRKKRDRGEEPVLRCTTLWGFAWYDIVLVRFVTVISRTGNMGAAGAWRLGG